MRPLLLSLMLLSACYPLRNARFVDESQDRKTVWLCAPDDEPTNPLGIECADLMNFKAARRVFDRADAGTKTQSPATM